MTVMMTASSRRIAAVTLACAVLVGCAGARPTTSVTPDEPTADASPTVAASAGAATEPAASSRTISTAFGPVDVPADPQRVAVLNVIAVDATHLTGVEPIVVPGPVRTLDDEGVGDAEVVVIGEVDVEALAVLEPDLILDGAFEGELFSGQPHDVLSEIAPVVAFDFVDDTQWKEYFAFFADAIGRAAEAEEVLADYDRQVEELSTALAERGDEPTVSVARVLSDQIGNYSQVGFAAAILDEVGIATLDSDAGGPDRDFFRSSAPPSSTPTISTTS